MAGTSVSEMRRRAVRLGAVVLLLVSAAAVDSRLVGALSRVPVLGGCDGRELVRPHAVSFCGDGNFYITNLRWSEWTTTRAAATGRAHQNDCQPFCAQGHFRVYDVLVRLSRPRLCADGSTQYTHLSYEFVDKKPPRISRFHLLHAPLGTTPKCSE